MANETPSELSPEAKVVIEASKAYFEQPLADEIRDRLWARLTASLECADNDSQNAAS